MLPAWIMASYINFYDFCVISWLYNLVLPFLQKVNLSSCSQITSAILLLSVLPSVYSTNPTLRNTITELPFNLEHCDRNHSPLSQKFFPTMSFEAVQEVDISKCQRLHVESAIECFSVSFPSLKTLKAAYLLNFDISFLHHLVRKCPMVCEVDLSTDISPVEQLPHVSPSPAKVTNVWNYSSGGAVCMSNQPESNITKLTLEGRNELRGEIFFMLLCYFFLAIEHYNFCNSAKKIICYKCVKGLEWHAYLLKIILEVGVGLHYNLSTLVNNYCVVKGNFVNQNAVASQYMVHLVTPFCI